MTTRRMLRRAAAASIALALTPALLSAPADAGPSNTTQPGPINAANTYGWYPLTWKYDWESGESDLAPWSVASDGSGVGYLGWAMIVLDSSSPLAKYNDPSTGSVSATLGGPGAAYGRWEIRMRVPTFGGGSTPYTAKAELVPAAGDTHCGAQNISLATFTPGGSSVAFSARNLPNQSWEYTLGGLSLDRNSWHTYAVEVRPDTVTWFVDAKVTAVVPTPAAVTGQPLTMRLSLAGVPGAEMVRSRIGVDWVRYFKLRKTSKKYAKKNREIKRAPSAQPTTYAGAC